jgi:hypothetical protein
MTANVFNPAISPDGRWFAYASQHEVYVQSIDPGGGRAQITQDDSYEPHWSTDGRELYVVKNNELFAVPLGPGPALTPGRPRRLSIDVLPLAVESSQTYSVDPKGGRFLVMRVVSDRPATPQVRFMLNGFSGGQLGK